MTVHSTIESFHHIEANHHHSITPEKLIRKLSHSKIITQHFPKLCGDNCEDCVKLKEEEYPLGEKDIDDKNDQPIEIKVCKDDESQESESEDSESFADSICGKYLGLILALLSSLMISLVTLIVKSMPQYHPFSVVIWRLQGILLPAALLIAYLRVGKKEMILDSFLPIRAPGKWIVLVLLVLRGIFGCSADIFQYYSLKYLSLADSSVISFSSPIFVTFVAYFALGEKCGIVSVLTGVMSLIGVIIIARPPMLTGEESFNTDILIGNGLALGCMAMATFTFVTLRSLRNVHFALTTFSFGFFGTIESLVLCWIVSTFDLPQGTSDWLMAIVIALMYCLGQLFFTLALQFEEAGPVSLVRTCDVIFAYLWQFIFLDVVPDVFSVIGGGIVISGVLITAFRKWLNELPEDDDRRKKYWILLR